MSFTYPYHEKINLHVSGRVAPEDAQRQRQTACEILLRLQDQPGLILADEVGMGKTFVALAVAASVALVDRKRPVVVMVPSSLREKWPRDFELFREKCLPPDVAKTLKYAKAERAVEFLKLLDDPPNRRKSLIFVTHGALSRGLHDPWVKLALIYRALYKRKNIENLRRALCRIVDKLLYMGWVDKRSPDVWAELLHNAPYCWLDILHKHNIDPEGDDNPDTDDDPVPEAVRNALWKLNTEDLDDLFYSLKKIPYKRTKNFEYNLTRARRAISKEIRELWYKCMRSHSLRLPLLILDEAHHLKNSQTRLSSLFHSSDAKADADEIDRGPLEGVFERMLFLTATPFQLGHYELCSVLERFNGISWRTSRAPSYGKDGFLGQIQDLRNKLDAAQESAERLDKTWGNLKKEDLVVNEQSFDDSESWWGAVTKTASLSESAKSVLTRFAQTYEKMRDAEKSLKPWVIRHLKGRKLPQPFENVERRQRFVGKAILDESTHKELPGISVVKKALLPFLLAARATVYAPDSRPIFAEGLASSYEAFLNTRIQSDSKCSDTDDDEIKIKELNRIGIWYLDKLSEILPIDDEREFSSHPKISATVERAVKLWQKGEKVLIFCHYIATGRSLRQHISAALQDTITTLGAKNLKCSKQKVFPELDRIGKRFFDVDSPLRRACDLEIGKILNKYPQLTDQRENIIEVIRRFLRTPSFLVRYLKLKDSNPTQNTILKGFDNKDGSGLSLRQILDDFFEFLVVRCGVEERNKYIDAIHRIQPGSIMGADVVKTFGEDEIQGDKSERLIPNVRLVNGQTERDSRQRIMLTFNTPFYPEILISSSVLAEGVDLQLNCRHVIHHDLCWNPSTLEQRTGRIDRIGAKAERYGNSIFVYIPYIAETQDEKMYRVVMDRERWFKVVMGESFKVDARTTEKLAERIPLPKAAAEKLAFRLEVSQK